MLRQIPDRSTPAEDLISLLKSHHGDDVNWRAARTFGLVYLPGEDVMGFVKQAYVEFMTENALGPTSFPSLRKFETEVIAMTANMLNGDEEVVGTMTSGGTESIFMSVKTARDYARHHRTDQGPWEILIPESAHPAFDKAAHYLDLKVVHGPLGADFRADVQATKELLTDRTIMMVGSACGYPHGVNDDIEALAALAHERSIWFHTDSCLGGFILPWAEKLGEPIAPFDFRVPGVVSMSADVHKYGYAAKGASTILYRNEDYRRHQFYVMADWCGGIYATPSLAGARTGGSIAAAWAVLQFLGKEGYMRLASRAIEAKKTICAGVDEIDGIKIVGEPHATVFAIAPVDDLNIYAVGDLLAAHGWHVERQHRPAALHLMTSPEHDKVAAEFVEDLRQSVDKAREQGPADLSQMSAMYGMMTTMPDRGAAKEMTLEVMTQLYK